MADFPHSVGKLESNDRDEAAPASRFEVELERDRSRVVARKKKHVSWATLTWLVLLLSFACTVYAQDGGIVSGLVINTWDGTPLSSVVVTVRGTTLAVQTGADGRFELKNVPSGDQTLRFSKSGFASATVTDVRVLTGQNSTVNGNLRPEFYEMEEYEVTAEIFTEETEKILIDRQQSSTMLDAVGSEQFSKLGAGDAGAIVSRVTGVSLVGGKYVVVRGLSDRYSRTLLNGLEVPSADPYRLAPQLDLFPAAMIDQISVSKTFMPDQPGATGGGMIDITTKSFPSEPFAKMTVGTSYNPNSNLKNNFLADPSSSMSPFSLPSAPKSLKSDLYGLTQAPNPPQPASSRETPTRAAQRGQQANDVQSLMQDLGTANFAGVEKSSPLNTKVDLSAGDTKKVFGNNLGIFGGLNYKKEFRQVEGTRNSYSPSGDPTKLGDEQIANITTTTGGNVNLGYEPWNGSQLGFNFLYAHNVDQEARHYTFGNLESRPDDTLEQWQTQYIDREIYNYQIVGAHEMPGFLNSKLNWGVAIADTTQDEPDQRFMNYYVTPGGQPQFGDASMPFPQYPSRYFREISEHGFNYRVDWTVPLEFMEEESKVKAGYYSSSSSRDYKEQYFSYTGESGFDLSHPNSYLNDPAYLQYQAEYLGGIRTNYNFSRYISDTYAHPYSASLDVTAVYLMSDVGVWPWLRVIAGARVEKTDMSLDAPLDGQAGIDQTDVLPAVSLVFTMVTNVNLRLTYGEALSRPSYREFAPVLSYLPDLGITALGNPTLQMSSIKSYDARLEWFPSPGDIVSGGIFYKTISQPIELVSRTKDDQQVTWINRPDADLVGIELEARKNMEFLSPHLKGLSLGGNATFVESTTKLTDDELTSKRDTNPNASDTRPLYEQSPYIINLDLTYEHPTSGTTFSLGANLTGERLILAKSSGPDIYEHPPVSLDVGISQKLWKHWTLRFGVRNLLDPEYRQTYGKGYDNDIYQSFKLGRTFSTSITAEF